MITIGEYIKFHQPNIAAILWKQVNALPTGMLDLSFAVWDRIMREPPRPGRAGILPEERRKKNEMDI